MIRIMRVIISTNDREKLNNHSDMQCMRDLSKAHENTNKECEDAKVRVYY